MPPEGELFAETRLNACFRSMSTERRILLPAAERKGTKKQKSDLSRLALEWLQLAEFRRRQEVLTSSDQARPDDTN